MAISKVEWLVLLLLLRLLLLLLLSWLGKLRLLHHLGRCVESVEWILASQTLLWLVCHHIHLHAAHRIHALHLTRHLASHWLETTGHGLEARASLVVLLLLLWHS